MYQDMPAKEQQYKVFEKNCEICGKPFRRSGPIAAPPRFCNQECLYQWRMGQRYEQYVVPTEYYEVIRRTYQESSAKGKIRELAKKLHVPTTKLTNLARTKGWIPKSRSTDWAYYWCDREDGIIEKTGHCSPLTVKRRLRAAGYRRSVSAIEIRRSKLRAVANRKGMSANQLAECMGIDDKSVLTLINRKKLHAERRPGYEGPRVAYHILPEAVREYIVQYLPEVNVAKMDKYWLVDLLTDGGIGA